AGLGDFARRRTHVRRTLAALHVIGTARTEAAAATAETVATLPALALLVLPATALRLWRTAAGDEGWQTGVALLVVTARLVALEIRLRLLLGLRPLHLRVRRAVLERLAVLHRLLAGVVALVVEVV